MLVQVLQIVVQCHLFSWARLALSHLQPHERAQQLLWLRLSELVLLTLIVKQSAKVRRSAKVQTPGFRSSTAWLTTWTRIRRWISQAVWAKHTLYNILTSWRAVETDPAAQTLPSVVAIGLHTDSLFTRQSLSLWNVAWGQRSLRRWNIIYLRPSRYVCWIQAKRTVSHNIGQLCGYIRLIIVLWCEYTVNCREDLAGCYELGANFLLKLHT